MTEYRTVTGVSGSTVTFSVPLGQSYPIGSGLAPPPAFLTAMTIFDKAGHSLGAITDYVVNQPRSSSIREPGSMDFYMPRNSPDVAMIASDRLVAITNNVGLPIWAGVITTQEWSGSTGNIHCEDILSLLAGVPIEMELEILDNTPATALYQSVIALVNTRRGLDAEISWGLDLQGTKAFLGDFSFAGDPLDAINEIADRTGTEFATLATYSGGDLAITLVVRDSFSAPAGVALTDGPGGNVAASPTYQVDPTTIVNGLRLTGDTTTIARYVEDWADWAVFEFEPVVEVYADTGTFRRRIDLNMSVDFSISKRQQRSLAQRTQDQVWDLYEHYLYAMHDLMGRINHEGWWYEGPTEEIEPQLTKDNWHTHVELVYFRDSRPASIVMKSDTLNEWVVVTYNGTLSQKSVSIYGFNSVYALQIADAHLYAGTYTIYEESGGRAQVYTTYTTAGEDWALDLASITAILPNGSRISLRAIKGPATFRGRYLDLREPTITVVPRAPSPNIIDAGNIVGNVWPIERGRIRDWDPRRDGTGALLNKTTVYSGQLTTRARWHFVPYSVGEQAETRLAEGISSVNNAGVQADVIFVESNASFPIGVLPFDILVGDPLVAQEIMTVYAAFGNRWSVYRGQTAVPVLTTASVGAGATVIPVTSTTMFVTGMVVVLENESFTIDSLAPTAITSSTALVNSHASGSTVTTNGLIYSHLGGTLVRLLGGVPFEGFDYGYTWPEGQAYAENLLARLRLPTRLISLMVTNENDDWVTFQFGSTHAVNIQSEGPPGGVVGTVRVIGMSPDEYNGTMEVIVEVLP